MKIYEYLFPFCLLHHSIKEINEKFKKLTETPEEYGFEFASTNPKIRLDILERTLATTLANKKELEDKAKSSLVAITISSALIFNIVRMLQDNLNDSVVATVFLMIISCISLLYMVVAGILSLYMLCEINQVSFPFPEDYILREKDQKEGLAQSIEANYLRNMKRNNCMNTSYKCIIVSISLFVLIFIFASLSLLTTKIDDDLSNVQRIHSIVAVEERLTNIEESLDLLSESGRKNQEQLALMNDAIDSLLKEVGEIKQESIANTDKIEMIFERFNNQQFQSE